MCFYYDLVRPAGPLLVSLIEPAQDSRGNLCLLLVIGATRVWCLESGVEA